MCPALCIGDSPKYCRAFGQNSPCLPGPSKRGFRRPFLQGERAKFQMRSNVLPCIYSVVRIIEGVKKLLSFFVSFHFPDFLCRVVVKIRCIFQKFLMQKKIPFKSELREEEKYTFHIRHFDRSSSVIEGKKGFP